MNCGKCEYFKTITNEEGKELDRGFCLNSDSYLYAGKDNENFVDILDSCPKFKMNKRKLSNIKQMSKTTKSTQKENPIKPEIKKEIKIEQPKQQEEVVIKPTIVKKEIDKSNLSENQKKIFDLFEKIQPFLIQDYDKKIKELTDNFSHFLFEKNKKYGDSALEPIKVFSKSDTDNSILIRMDDKINRIKNSDEIAKNDICDLFGYLSLFMIHKGWNTFDEFLD